MQIRRDANGLVDNLTHLSSHILTNYNFQMSSTPGAKGAPSSLGRVWHARRGELMFSKLSESILKGTVKIVF